MSNAIDDLDQLHLGHHGAAQRRLTDEFAVELTVAYRATAAAITGARQHDIVELEHVAVGRAGISPPTRT
ncbi:hypothetical protein [Nocardia flavorosea]|uniref:Uncharacterized protein n=1 Tax=Nocardia flavorosea TaxID=53429 RepID=A0A846YJ98_9NOCA|nr:hypothetical protein [Nocardia flavorosea]NKY57652.1 hypothetical protein [Nocardia flavorosea]